MNNQNSDFTGEKKDAAEGDGGRTQISQYDYESTVESVRQKTKRRRSFLLGLFRSWSGIAFLSLLFVFAAGLMITFVAKVRDAAMGATSQNNLKQMGLGITILVTNSTNGVIPPSYGPFPPANGKTASHFEHLLPYIQSWGGSGLPAANTPLRFYIAPADPRNPGTDGTMSYCSNATLLSGHPRLPESFNGRLSSEIVLIMERSGLDGAHKWSTSSNSLGAPDNPPPFPQIGVSPSSYLEGSPQGFSSRGCRILCGDGSVRLITDVQEGIWNNLCDPAEPAIGANW